MHSEDSFRYSGLRICRLFGIDIWIHWVLLLIIGLKLIDILLKTESPYGEPLIAFASFALALLLTILLHEFGHAYAAHRQGGSAERIILWPLGGLAVCESPQTPRARFWVSAGGPLVNLGLGLLVTLLCLVLGLDFLPFSGQQVFWQRLLQYLFLWNFVLLIVNLLPCYPLDGGQILHSFLWSRIGSHHGALLATLKISKFTAILALLFGGSTIVFGLQDETWRFNYPFIDELGFVSLFCGLMYFITARQVREELAYGGEDSDSFGYDFAGGYTSLESQSSGEKGPGFLERRKLKRQQKREEKKEEEHRQMQERLDELLGKIHEQGMDSLSEQERKFLETTSEKLRKTN
ncbi:MAG: site-2 protease family protein [Planctomycetota bacterium]|nr:site-2 protease family protein [Planctomycetota bacterium]